MESYPTSGNAKAKKICMCRAAHLNKQQDRAKSVFASSPQYRISIHSLTPKSSDEGLTPETSAFSTLYGGQFTTSTYQITSSLNRYMATWNLFVN